MKTAKFGCISLIVALLLFAASYGLFDQGSIVWSARISAVSFVFMIVGLGLITFDKRWAKERHEIENDD